MKNLYKYPKLSIWISLIVMMTGLFILSDINISLYPDVSQPVVQLSLSPNGVGAVAFKGEYGERIESTLMGIEDVEEVEGFYRDGSASWQIKFPWNYESKKALSEVRNAVSGIGSSFPREWGGFYAHFYSQSTAMLFLSVRSDIEDQRLIETALEDTVRMSVEAIDGVDAVFISNPNSQWVVIELNLEKMGRLMILPETVRSAVRDVLYNKNLGVLSTTEKRYQLVVPLMATNLEELKQAVVKRQKGVAITLADIAEVKIKTETTPFVFHDNGQRAFIFGVNIKPSANINRVSERALEVIEQEVYGIDPHAKIVTLMDPAKFIKDAINSMYWAIVAAIVAAALVILFFLRSFSSMCIIALSIPFSLAGGIILMMLLGIQINLLSLSAMALAVGMVVDGAIVVIENIERHRLNEQKRGGYISLLKRAMGEVRGAITASTFTTVIVFFPLIFTKPLTHALLGDLAIVTVTVLLVSLLVTLVIIPPLFLFVMRKGYQRKEVKPFWFERSYVALLEMMLHRRLLSALFLVAVIGAVGSSLFLLSEKVPREIVSTPQSDKLILIFQHKHPAVTPEEAEKRIIFYEEQLDQEMFSSYLDYHMALIELSRAQILCVLKNPNDAQKVKDLLEEKLEVTEGSEMIVVPWNPATLTLPTVPLLEGTLNPSGRNREEVRQFLEEYNALAKESDYIAYSATHPNDAEEATLRCTIKDYVSEYAGGEYNRLTYALWDTIRHSVEVGYLDSVRFDGVTYPVKMSYQGGELHTVEDILELEVVWKEGRIPLKNVIAVEEAVSWNQIYSKQGVEQYLLRAFLKDAYEAVKEEKRTEFTQKVQRLARDHGMRIALNNPEQEVEENLLSLLYALGIAFLLLWMMLSYEFGPGVYPILILLPIPLGLVGTAFSLYLFSSTLSLNSMLGMILLAGTAVNNSIIFVDFYLKRCEAHQDETLLESILATAQLRIRPILMTTLTTVIGMLPLALALTQGADIIQPLGITVCGGLIVSTLLTIFILPILLSWKGGEKEKVHENNF